MDDLTDSLPASPSPSELPPNLADPSPSGDISKHAILVLLVLTIFVSAFGTWMVLKATDSVTVQPLGIAQEPAGDSGTVGHVAINIKEKTNPVDTNAAGFVVVNINNQREA